MPSATEHAWAAELATEMINENGRAMALRTLAKSGDDWNPTLTPSDAAIVGAEVDYRTNEVDGDLVKKNDKKIYIDSSVEPNTDMRLIDDSNDYSIISVMTKKPGMLTTHYVLQVRL